MHLVDINTAAVQNNNLGSISKATCFGIAIWIVSMSAAFGAKPETPNLEVRSIQIRPTQNSKLLNGSACIELVNPYPFAVKIPVAKELARKVYVKLKPESDVNFSCSIDGNKDGDYWISEFANVEYTWKKGDKPILENSYTLVGNPIVINAKDSSQIIVPLELPKERGLFNLCVTFDNRSIYIPYSASNRIISEKVLFFKKTCISRVEIK